MKGPGINKTREYESPINEFRVAKGLTHRELKKQVGVSQSMISALASGTTSPLTSKGRIKRSAQKLVDFFSTDVATLFPRYFCDFTRNKELEKVLIREDKIPDSMQFEDPEALLELKIFADDVLKLGWGFKDRRSSKKHKKRFLHIFLLYHVQEYTLEEIGIEFSITRERVRQIIEHTLRQLKKHYGENYEECN